MHASLDWTHLPSPLLLLAVETDGVGPQARITGLAALRVAPGRAPERLHLPHLPEGLAPSWPRLSRMLRGAVLVTHGARVHEAALRRELEDLGLELESPALCTLALARRLRPRTAGSLPALARELGLPRAAPDLAGEAEATLAVLEVLAAAARPALLRGLIRLPAPRREAA